MLSQDGISQPGLLDFELRDVARRQACKKCAE
jgi:hypothetical protein